METIEDPLPPAPSREQAPIIETLQRLHLPPERLLVVGSAVLQLHGIRRYASDIDILAEPETIDEVEQHGIPDAHAQPVDSHLLSSGQLEVRGTGLHLPVVLHRFEPLPDRPDQTFAEAWQEADRMAGFAFISLAGALAHKSILGRNKDRRDLTQIKLHQIARRQAQTTQ